jgi:hypothetical protein
MSFQNCSWGLRPRLEAAGLTEASYSKGSHL